MYYRMYYIYYMYVTFTGPGGGIWTSLGLTVLPTTAVLCVLDSMALSRSPCRTEALISPFSESVGSWQVSPELCPGNCPLLKRIVFFQPQIPVQRQPTANDWLMKGWTINSSLSLNRTPQKDILALGWQRTVLWLYCSSCVILLSLPPTPVGPEDTPPLSFLPANLHLRVCFWTVDAKSYLRRQILKWAFGAGSEDPINVGKRGIDGFPQAEVTWLLQLHHAVLWLDVGVKSWWR